MEKRIIVRIGEGLGNQLFMYANAYALSKAIGYNLYLDSKSGYFKKKNQNRFFELDKFNININYADDKLIFNSYTKDIKRKILKLINRLLKNKKFLLEYRDKNKQTRFFNYLNTNYHNIFFIEGHFESEKFFHKFKDDLKKQFTLKDNFIDKQNPYIEKIDSTNSISICVRQNRFSEGYNKNILKSNEFTKKTIEYIYRGVDYFENKLKNPIFFVWSNDFTNLDKYFDKKKFIFVQNNKENKSLNDFYLFKYCKHFIVGPTSFHWWGAWLNENKNKICLRPKNINVSNNRDLWPEKWISI